MIERGVGDGFEGRVVGALEAELVVEAVAGIDQFEVGFANRANDELGDRAGPASIPGIFGGILAADVVGPFDRLEEFVVVILLGGELFEALTVGGFEIDRDAAGEFHGADELVKFDAGHDLHVEVAAVVVFAAEDFGGVEEFVLGLDAAADDAGAEEDTFDGLGFV